MGRRSLREFGTRRLRFRPRTPRGSWRLRRFRLRLRFLLRLHLRLLATHVLHRSSGLLVLRGYLLLLLRLAAFLR